MDDHNYPSPSPKRRKCSEIKSSETPAKVGLESTTVTTTAKTVVQNRDDHMTDSPEDFVKQADDNQQFQKCFPREMTTTSTNQSSQRKEQSRSFAHLPTGEPGVNESSSDQLKHFDNRILTFMKEEKIPSVSLVIAKGEQILYTQCYGWASQDVPVRPHHLFRIASISKVFTAVAVMKLCEKGKLNLKDKVFGPKGILKCFCPTHGFLDRRVLRITVTHLLQHSAGWDRDVVGDPCFWKHVGGELGIQGPVDPQALIGYMLEKQKLQFNPGSRYAYSNLGYLVLGRVIEQASGHSYEEYVQELLGQVNIRGVKLGKTRKKEADPAEVEYYPWPEHISVDSIYPDEGKVTSPYGSYAMESGDADGGWLATPLHLVQLFQSLEGRRGPPILKPQTFKNMLEKPSYAKGDGAWYGFGLDVAWNKKAWEHGGHIDGATGVLTHDRHGYTWAFLANYWPPESDYTSLLTYGIAGVRKWSTPQIFDAISQDVATIDSKFIVKVKVPHSELSSIISQLSSQGYSPTWVNTYHVVDETFCNIIAKHEDSKSRQSFWDLDREGMISLVSSREKQGYVPMFVDSYLHDDQMKYVVILSANSSTQWALHESLTLEELELKNKEMTEKGFMPKVQSVVAGQSGSRVCVLFTKENVSKCWAQCGKTLKQYEGEAKKRARYGHMLSYMKAYREDVEVKFSLIWTNPGPYRYTVEHDMSKFRVLNDVLRVSQLKFWPWLVCGYEGAEDEGQPTDKFAAVCVKQVPQQGSTGSIE